MKDLLRYVAAKALCACLAVLVTCAAAIAQPTNVNTYIPTNAVPLLPVLGKTIDSVWPDMPMRSFAAAMIEKESCITLTHKKCWNSHAELRTSREYGFGLGQATIAYRADGTERFNVWKDLTSLDPTLKREWTWENRYDPAMQMRALIVKNRINYSALRFPIADQTERMAFLAVYYNSGSPLVDRNICIRTKGCDPTRWFAGIGYTAVSSFTAKSTVVAKGYGRSFATISREYPVNVVIIRRPKYVGAMGS